MRTRDRDALIALGLVLLAWLHRVLFLVSNRDRDYAYSIFYEGDAETFFNYARALLSHAYYDGGVPFHPPLFAVVLAGVHTLVGAGAPSAEVPSRLVRAIVALLGSVPVGILYLLVRPYAGRAAALAAALFWTYSFASYVLSVSPVSEGLYLTLLLLALLLWTRLDHPLVRAPENGARPRKDILAPFGLGALLGALCLTRAEGVLVGLVLVAFLVVGPRARSRWRIGAIVLLGWVLCLTPWTVRNALRLRDINRHMATQLAEPLPTFVPITAYGPLNLALANHEGADGTFSAALLPASAKGPAGALQLTDPAHLHLFLHGQSVAWRFVRQHPARFGRLVLRKWGLMLGATRLGWTQWDLPGGLSGVRRPVDVFVPFTSAGTWLSVPWILAGIAIGWAMGGAARRFVAIVLVVTACTFATTALFFGYARLGALLLPLWYALGALALVWSWRRAGSPGIRRATPVAAVLVVALLAIEGWGATRNRNYEASGTTLPGSTMLNPHETMTIRAVR